MSALRIVSKIHTQVKRHIKKQMKNLLKPELYTWLQLIIGASDNCISNSTHTHTLMIVHVNFEHPTIDGSQPTGENITMSLKSGLTKLEAL
jgi:hypothetical protein